MSQKVVEFKVPTKSSRQKPAHARHWRYVWLDDKGQPHHGSFSFRSDAVLVPPEIWQSGKDGITRYLLQMASARRLFRGQEHRAA